MHFKNLNHDMFTDNGISFGFLVGQVAEFDLAISSHSLSLSLMACLDGGGKEGEWRGVE